MTKLIVALLFMGLNSYTYHLFATKAVIPDRQPFMIFPAELGNGWSCPKFERMDDNVEAELGVTDYLLCTFVNRERNEIANVYVGYHVTQVREDGGGSENSIHPPAHCLPGSGWDIIRNETVPLDIPGLPQENATAKRLVIAKGNQRNLVYYWYQSRGRVISQDWQKIIFVGLDRATRQRTDGSLIRITVPMRRSGEAVAQAVFDSIAPEIVSRLSEYVPE
ncbi:MAG: EpsI family protein [Myxococcales bacterium]|nr:EpsI family protein [Myxococcales bacterium]